MVNAGASAPKPNWKHRFGISARDLRGIAPGSPDADVLTACLLEGKISEAEYLEWAMDSFGLPAVTPDYFETPHDPRFWDAVKDLYSWSPNFFPLTQWEGVILIACVTPPPAAIALGQPFRLVLASARKLNALWTTLNPSVEHTDTGIELHSLSSAMGSSHDDQPNFDGIDNFSLPDGVAFSPKPSATQPARPSNRPATQPNFKIDAPAGVALNPDEFADHSAAPEGLSFPGAAKVPELSGAPDGITLPDDLEKTVPLRAIKSSQQAVPKTASPPDHAPQVSDDDKIDRSFSETSVNFTLSGVGETNGSGTAMHHAAQRALAKTVKYFDGAMILLHDNVSAYVKPWKWTDSLSSANNSELPTIDLNEPSPFRIVFRSRLPFHGSVSPSPMNEEFAQAFNSGKLPAHLTILPIRHNHQWQGMLLGMANNPVDLKLVLSPMSKIADEFGEQLVKLSKKPAA